MRSSPSGAHREVMPGRFRLVAPACWALWEQPRRVVVYVLAVVLTATAATLVALAVAPVPPADLGMFALLVSCCVGYGEASRHVERARRQYSGTPHIDLNSMWMFAAVLLLHPALTAVLIATFYLHRWLRVAHRTVHRVAFNVAAAVCSAAAVSGFLAIVDRYHTFADLPRDLTSFAVVAVAVAVFMLVNTTLVCAAIALSTQDPTLRGVTADWSDYGLELATLALGVLLAWALADWPAMALPVVGVTLALHGKVPIHRFREAARTDAKTGLLNTDGWYEAAHREIAQAGRQGHGVGILVVDLDRFKRVNDNYGHLAGDDVLCAVAAEISEQVRRKGVVGRFGGEEFLVLLPAVEPASLLGIADRIRDRISKLVLPVRANHGAVLLRDLTASVGIAAYPTHGEQLDDLLHAADAALFEAKASGRNRVAYAALD